MRIRNVFGTLLVAAAFGLAPGQAAAAAFGIFSQNGTAATNTSAVVTGLGHTAAILADLTAADLAGLDVLWVLNQDNGGQPAEVISNLAVIESFVFGGGVLSYHDRNVEDAASVIPGAGSVTFVNDFGDDANIDVLGTAPAVITSGPGGTIDNSTLDGGTSSSHGYAQLATLPAGAVAVFSRANPAEIVDFYFTYGAGLVYYSTIPLDFYMEGFGPAGVQANMSGIYAANEATFQAGGVVAAPVPEPGTYALFATGLVGLVAQRLRRRQR